MTDQNLKIYIFKTNMYYNKGYINKDWFLYIFLYEEKIARV